MVLQNNVPKRIFWTPVQCQASSDRAWEPRARRLLICGQNIIHKLIVKKNDVHFDKIYPAKGSKTKSPLSEKTAKRATTCCKWLSMPFRMVWFVRSSSTRSMVRLKRKKKWKSTDMGNYIIFQIKPVGDGDVIDNIDSKRDSLVDGLQIQSPQEVGNIDSVRQSIRTESGGGCNT